jgi:DNA-binding Lrp family transcriptional regulator
VGSGAGICYQEGTMVCAIVLLSVERDQIHATAERIAGIDGVSEVYSVAGPHDLAVMVRAKDHERLADLVTRELLLEPGILKSETLFAFRVYSRYDIEHLFSIGLEQGPGRE